MTKDEQDKKDALKECCGNIPEVTIEGSLGLQVYCLKCNKRISAGQAYRNGIPVMTQLTELWNTSER